MLWPSPSTKSRPSKSGPRTVPFASTNCGKSFAILALLHLLGNNASESDLVCCPSMEQGYCHPRREKLNRVPNNHLSMFAIDWIVQTTTRPPQQPARSLQHKPNVGKVFTHSKVTKPGYFSPKLQSPSVSYCVKGSYRRASRLLRRLKTTPIQLQCGKSFSHPPCAERGN